MENNKINATELYEVINDILSIIDNVNSEVNVLSEKNQEILNICSELHEMNGKKVAITDSLNEEDFTTQIGFKRCSIYGEKELSSKTLSFYEKLDQISSFLNGFYDKMSKNRNVALGLEQSVSDIENILSSEAEVLVVNDCFNQQNNEYLVKNNVMNAIDTNFKQNKFLTNKVSDSVYRKTYDKLQEMFSNNGGVQK